MVEAAGRSGLPEDLRFVSDEEWAMHSARTDSTSNNRLKIHNAEPRFGSSKLAAVVRASLALAILSVLLIAARPALAQTETVLHSFTGTPDGAYPASRLTADGAGNLYGTTYEGGTGVNPFGTVFELSPDGSGGWNETVLYSFCSDGMYCTDGGYPYYSYVMFDSSGNLYGTTSYGGTAGGGVLFELSPVGGGIWKETVLYNFGGSDALPTNGLIRDSAGNFYGVTDAGGGFVGSVFEVSPSGDGWTEQVIYTFDSTYAGLTMDSAGNIFGAGFTTVFELSPNGNGGWNPTVIHTFTSSPKDGTAAYGTPVLDKNGNLYGTTLLGGAKDGGGTVYKLSPGNKGWTEKILHSFEQNGKEGGEPLAGVMLDAAGNIYGTASSGGKFGGGVVYELVAPVGKGGYTEKILRSFNIYDGCEPFSSLIQDSAGNLYGTTYHGGPLALCGGQPVGDGVVFEVTGVFEASATTLTSSPNPSSYGEAVTFSAVVTPKAGPPPNGEIVSFMNGKTLLGTGTLSGGSASFPTSVLKVGTTSVTAVYGGDSKLLGSKSTPVNQVVNAGN